MKDHEYRTTVLDSGLTVHTVNIPGAKKKYYEVLILSGSASEKDITGVAHYLEHMFGYGSNEFGEQDMFPYFNKVGGDFNFATSYFYTVYYGYALPYKVDEYAERLSTMLTDPVFNSDMVEGERARIINEELGKRPFLDIMPFFKTGGKLYDGHRYSIPNIGTPSDIQKISYDDLREYYDATYAASNIHVIVAGNIDHDEEVEKAKRYYATLSQKPLTLKPDPLLTVVGTHFEPMNIGSVDIKIGFPFPKSAPERDSLDIILAFIINQKLHKFLVEEKKLIYGVGAGIDFMPFENGLVIELKVDPSSLKEVLNEIFTTLKLAAENTNKDYLLSFIAEEEEWLVECIDNVRTQAERVSSTLQKGNGYRPLSANFNLAKTLSEEDLRAGIKRLLSSEKVFMTAAGPVEDVPKIEPYVQKLRDDLGIGGSDPAFGVQQGLNPNVT